MRECAVCHTKSDDAVKTCGKCGADLNVDSVTARSLREIMANPRVTAIFIVAPDHACPACRRAQGTYYKTSDATPSLPTAGCSCPNGCVCSYEPLVVEVGP